jgi:hypothetical protein
MRQFTSLCSLVLFFWIACAVGAADLRLSIVALDAERRPTLLLSGLDSGQYALEASTNLVQWSSLVTSPGSTGELRYLHADAPSFRNIYYRGLKLSEPLARIVPQVDSNYLAVGVVTYQEGGSLSLTNDGGTRFTFTVAPSNVFQSVAISMRLVTNFAAFPYQNEMRTAVQFEPDGFVFHGAGLLEIQFPTNVPHLQLSSFAFDGGGGDFHLVPDRVRTNSVRIPVTHFSVFGTAVWGPTERTSAFNAQADTALSTFQNQAAKALGEERARMLLGGEETESGVPAEVLKSSEDYYDRYLKSEFEAAGGDCSLFRSLVPRVLGHERQLQLLGVEGAPSFLSSAAAQKAMCNCVNDLIFACEEASISAESFLQGMLGIERQSQLLGLNTLENCGLGTIQEWISDALAKKLPCLTKWIGTVSYSESGTFSRERTTAGADSTALERESVSVQYSFEGGVERVELQDDSIPGIFSSETWDLYFFPDASGALSRKRKQETNYQCKDEFGVQQETTSILTVGQGSGSNEAKVHFVFEDGELTAFTILQRKGLTIQIPVALQGTRTGCPKKDPITGLLVTQSPVTTFDLTSASSQTFDTDFVPTSQVVFSRKSPTELVGTATGLRQDIVLETAVLVPYTWKFSLRRRPE